MSRQGFSSCTPFAAVGCCLFLFVSSAIADDLMECVQSVDHSIEGQLLTEEEVYQMLLQRLADDQIRFEECLVKFSAGRGGGGASGGGSGSGNSSSSAGGGQLTGQSTDGSQTFAAALESISTPGVQGTELPESENQDELSPAILNEITPGTVADGGKRTLTNGMEPEDLEVSDNDAILLSQILAAANAEQDPDKKEKLMKEYHRMKSGKSGETAVVAGGQK